MGGIVGVIHCCSFALFRVGGCESPYFCWLSSLICFSFLEDAFYIGCPAVWGVWFRVQPLLFAGVPAPGGVFCVLGGCLRALWVLGVVYFLCIMFSVLAFCAGSG